MSLPISTDHPTFLLRDKVQAASKNFMNAFGFSYFQYLRCFADGSISLLTNNTSLFEYYQSLRNTPVVYSTFEKKHANTSSYWLLWDEDLAESNVQLAREKFNIRNGLTLVRRSKTHYDLIGFALPQEEANPGSFYLNKLKVIEQFVNDFDKDNKELLQLVNKNPIGLPLERRDANYKDICLTKGKITIAGGDTSTYITIQELAVLKLIFQAYSYKQVAALLNISPRTVETYVMRVKQRTALSLVDVEQLLLFGSAV